MSKASEWSRRANDAADALSDAKAAKPEPFALALNAKDRLYVVIEDNGAPLFHIATTGRYSLDTQQVIDLAHWILDTFGESQ